MNSAEKIARCMAIEPVKERSDIPVIMQIITYAGVCAGMTQKEIHENNESFQKAKKFTYDTVGYPDGDYFLNPGDTCFAEALPVRRPGIELSDNELFQFVETENMQPEDYDDIAKKRMGSMEHEVHDADSEPANDRSEPAVCPLGTAWSKCRREYRHDDEHGSTADYRRRCYYSV